MAAEKRADGSALIGKAMIPMSPEAPLRARTAVARWLLARAPVDVRADACLLVSELVTNSVRHSGMPAGAPVRVGAEMVDGMVRVGVADEGRAGVVRRRRPDGGGGFGLHLLDRLAARWGVEREPGTRVWFELSVAPASGGPTSPVPH
jgi:anti-sigma regulatory factor (Ser/Thr protein kinase)